MPEAFGSVADMRVVIDSSTDKLEAGLTVAKNLVARFAADGGQNLSLFDRAVATTAGGITAIASKANLVLGGIEAIKGVIDSIGPVLETFAAQTGSEDQLEDLKTAAADLQGAVLTGLKTAFDDVKQSAVETVSSILGFDSSVQEANTTSSSAAADGLAKLADAFRYVRRHIEDLLPEQRRSLSTLEDDVAAATEKLQALQEELAALETMNVSVGGSIDQRSLDLLKQEISGLQTQVFVLNQMAGAERIVRDAKADRAVESSKGIEGLRAETEAMELNVETMRMSTAESALYRAELKARAKLEEEDLDEDAIDRVIDKLSDRYSDAAEQIDNFNRQKKHGEDAKQYLDRLNQETDALRDRVAVLGMASAAAAAYTQQARNQRAIAALGDLDPDTLAKVNAQLAEQERLNQKIAASEEQRKRQQDTDRQDRTAQNAINALQRDVANEQLRASAIGQTTTATQAQAAEERALMAIRQSGREPNDREIAQIRALGEARQEATEQLLEQQQQLRMIGEVGNAVTSNLDSAFRRWAKGSEVTVKDMAASILADLAEIQFKAAVLNPLANFLTGSQSGGGGILGSLFGIGSGSSASSPWSTSVIPAFADGGDFLPGPIQVGERGPEVLWPTFPGRVIPNNALPNVAASSGPPVINMPVTINAQGAYPESIADIKAALAETQASIPQTAVAAYQEARDRGVVQ